MGFLVSAVNFILGIINNLGYLGIFIGMTIGSTPVPLPSEIILIPAGALMAHGSMKFLPIFLASSFGGLLGSYFNYFLALFAGRKSLEKFSKNKGGSFLINQKKLAFADNYYKKHGEITTVLTRLIPGVRHVIALPAGFAKMNFGKFTLFTYLGEMIWATFLTLLGYFFANNAEVVKEHMVLVIIIVCVIIVSLYLIINKITSDKKGKKKKKGEKNEGKDKKKSEKKNKPKSQNKKKQLS